MINLPSAEQPREVKAASDALQTAEERLEDARRERQAREAGVREAESLDRADLADRLVQDPEARPSREHRDRAEAELAEAEEIEAAAAQNLEAASERAANATLEHVEAWAKAVETARAKADSVFSKAISKLREAEAARAELRGVGAWLRQLEHGGALWLKGGGGGTVRPSRGAQALPGQLDVRDPRNADSKLSVAYALELLEQYAQTTSVEGEREAEQRRLEAERQAEERQQHMRQMRAGLIQPR